MIRDQKHVITLQWPLPPITIAQITSNTLKGYLSPLCMRIIRNRVLPSTFHRWLAYPFNFWPNWADQKPPAVDNVNVNKAIAILANLIEENINACGLLLHPYIPWLCGVPHGITDNAVVLVVCSNKEFAEEINLVESLEYGFLLAEDRTLYYEVQVLMGLANKNQAYVMFYRPQSGEFLNLPCFKREHEWFETKYNAVREKWTRLSNQHPAENTIILWL
jgi:hypothetical protein